jgi:hypothetical protein
MHNVRGVILSSYIFACKQINKPNECKTNVTENQRCNHEWTIYRHKTQDKHNTEI